MLCNLEGSKSIAGVDFILLFCGGEVKKYQFFGCKLTTPPFEMTCETMGIAIFEMTIPMSKND